MAPTANYAFTKTEDLVKRAIERKLITETDQVPERKALIDNLTKFDVDNPPAPEPDKKVETGIEDWKQEEQEHPERFYMIRRESVFSAEGNKSYKEIPTFYADGVWWEDEKHTVECSYWENLSKEAQDIARSKGEIR